MVVELVVEAVHQLVYQKMGQLILVVEVVELQVQVVQEQVALV